MSGDYYLSGSADLNATNRTLLCSAKNLQNPVADTAPLYVEESLRYGRIIYYLFLCFFGIPLNIIVLILVLKFKKLPSYLLCKLCHLI